MLVGPRNSTARRYLLVSGCTHNWNKVRSFNNIASEFLLLTLVKSDHANYGLLWRLKKITLVFLTFCVRENILDKHLGFLKNIKFYVFFLVRTPGSLCDDGNACWVF